MPSNVQIEYVEPAHLYTANYLRNSKAIGVLWGVFTVCFAIIDVVVFVQPQWIGDTVESHGTGYFGLWKHCVLIQDGQEILCKGSLTDFDTILNPAFRAATVFVGLSVIVILLCVCSMLFFFFFSSSTVFQVCGWLQVFSASFLTVGVLAFPAGWDDPSVQEVCGPASRDFYPGQCGLRWAYILAVIGIGDAAVLAALAFTLAVRHVKLMSLQPFTLHQTPYKGEVNAAYVGEGRPGGSAARRPVNGSVVMVPKPVHAVHHDPHDRMSEFSHRTGRSRHSSLAYRAEYATSSHQFQL